MSDLAIDRFCPPLNCFFVECDDFVQSGVRSELDSLESLVFDELPWTAELAAQVSPDSVVMLGVRIQDREAALRTIHELHDRRVVVLVTGNPEIRSHSLLFQTAGAVAVVTSLFGCDKLASVIRRAAGQRRQVLTSWRTRFVNRMPWNPV